MYNFSPDFEVEGPDKNGNYSIRPRTFEDSNNKFWGLDPDAKFPQGAKHKPSPWRQQKQSTELSSTMET